MDKVVSQGICIDLHIHSCYSSGKDGAKVKNNTLDNLGVLVGKLNSCGVEMCAITDHDTFNYNLYQELKKQEGKGCIKKVLPGVEFSVQYNVKDEVKTIHIVTIFNDDDENKVKKIEDILKKEDYVKEYKSNNKSFWEKTYFKILEEINLDFVMIGHQKKSLMSTDEPKNNDVNSLGQEKFNEFIFSEYFDAFEFRNKNNDRNNKLFEAEHEVKDKIRFITGSDCHNWEHYPKTEGNDKKEFVFTYIKALPTFKGLAMAITDNNRINLKNNFFNPGEIFYPNIELEVEGEKITIPLSKGINVIIGDNSIGKSLLLHAITGYYKCKPAVKKGYGQYLEENNVLVNTNIAEGDIFQFNAQGEIRQMFETEGKKSRDYLKQFFPAPINAKIYRKPVEEEFERLYTCIQEKFNYDEKLKNLGKFKIAEESNDKSITFVREAPRTTNPELKELTDEFYKGKGILQKIANYSVLDPKDKKAIHDILETIEIIEEKYRKKLEKQNEEQKKVNTYNTFMRKYESDYQERMSDEGKLYSQFINSKQNTIEDIVKLLHKKDKISNFEFAVNEEDINPERNYVDQYIFTSQFKTVKKISNEYLKEVLKGVLKKDTEIIISDITEEKLLAMIKGPINDGDNALEALKNKINKKLDSDFTVENTVIKKEMNIYKRLSDGFNSQIYFTLLSGERRNRGIYIVDQPEDHISQRAIKGNVLNEFRQMGKTRQIIMVTHNPQFIVNLDADNVIFLTKQDGKFQVYSGALEYEDTSYKILKIVADNIDDGTETIMKRMKCYDKQL